MAKITAINMQTKIKDRCNIFVDDEYFCSISLETVLKYRLKVGYEFEKDDFATIINENEKSEALNKALNYISKYLKTKNEVKNYLLGKGYSESVAFYCIDKLKEYKYIDDEEYSKRYIESVSKTQGKRLTELYSNAYVYVLPSDVEGMPLSLLEAMSYGNCCLVSDIAECAEVVEDKASCFAAGAPGLSRCVLLRFSKLLRNPCADATHDTTTMKTTKKLFIAYPFIFSSLLSHYPYPITLPQPCHAYRRRPA